MNRENDKINSLNKQSKIESMEASMSVVCIYQMLTINAAFSAGYRKVLI